MFGGEQELATVAGGVGGEQQATASGLQHGRSGTRRVQGVSRGLAQGAGQQDGAGGLVSELDEGRQATRETRDGTGRINDEQAGVEVANEGGQVVQVLGESVRARAGEGQRRILEEGMHEQQMGGIAPGGFEARFEGVGGRVVGGQENDEALVGGCAIGQGRATGDAGGQGEGHEGEARAWGAIEQGEVAKGDATGPQPGERFTGHVREEVGGWLGSWRLVRRLLLFEGAFVVGNVALEVAPDEIVHVSGFHSEGPFGVIPCALKKGIGGGTMVEGCQAQVRGGWV